MSEPKKDVPEPSMEEILSSIRKIIAEEETTDSSSSQASQRPAAPQPEAPQSVTAFAGDDVLELTDRVDDDQPDPTAVVAALLTPLPSDGERLPSNNSNAAPHVVPTISAGADPAVSRSAAAAATPPDQESSMPDASPLVSNNTAAMSAAAFTKLARAAAPAANEAPLPISGMTVEQLLMSMLEPMLKEWFDKHLPQVVERIVEEEVKKLVKRAELQ